MSRASGYLQRDHAQEGHKSDQNMRRYGVCRRLPGRAISGSRHTADRRTPFRRDSEEAEKAALGLRRQVGIHHDQRENHPGESHGALLEAGAKACQRKSRQVSEQRRPAKGGEAT